MKRILPLLFLLPLLVWAADTISPSVEALTQSVTTTGIVTPRNRLEVRPPVAGRLEKMLVEEGQFVHKGAPLATLSSTDRATLIDAAQGKGPDELKYWEEVYKPIQLVAPMDSTVIVATLQPGQVVATTDPIVVLSDRLIVQAQVDETDIGKIALNQKATLTLDSFPNTPVEATVEHIYYESVVSSNVTVYKVDLKLSQVPDFFRSGMNAQVAFETHHKNQALTLPLDAVNLSSDPPTVTILNAKGQEQSVAIEIGLATDKKIEILQGLTPASRVVVKSKRLQTGSSDGKNPFMPQFGGRRVAPAGR